MIKDKKNCYGGLYTTLQTAQTDAKSADCNAYYKRVIIALAMQGFIPLGLIAWINEKRGDRVE
jgi:hypothetical protein